MFFQYGPEIGFVKLTSSGVVGDSGKAQALYGYAFQSDGTVGVISFFNGTSSVSPSTLVFNDTGVVNVTKVVPLNCGVVFPNGLFASFDSHVTPYATLFVRQVLT